MRPLFIVLLALLAAVSLALYARHDPGYVLVQFRGWTMEASLALSVAVLLLVFVLSYLLVRLLLKSYRMPSSLREWRRRRGQRLALVDLERGFADLLAGRWERAEKRLAAAAARRESGALLNYLGAARAADEQGESERRDHYLQCAGAAMPEAELGLALDQAAMQIGKKQFAQAQANLDRLHGMAPRNPLVLSRLLTLYLELGAWDRLLDLLPLLRRRELIDEREADGLALRAAIGLLESSSPIGADAGVDRDAAVAALQTAWSHLPAELRTREALLRRYAGRLIECGAADRAELVLRDALEARWEPSLVYLYGLLDSGDAEHQLRHAEGWLRRHPGDAVLLLSLGRLCRRRALWGKARDYLQACVHTSAMPEACGELAAVLDEMGEHSEALQWYRRAGAAVLTETRRLAWRDDAAARLPRPGDPGRRVV